MTASSSPLTITTERSSDPLVYLNPLDRALCGWAVVRMFATYTPRFAKVLEKYGPKGAAYYGCVRTFGLYCFPLGVAAFVAAFASRDLSDFFFVMLGVSWLLGTMRIFSMRRAGQEYRQSGSDSG
jgi:hypothetical protein